MDAQYDPDNAMPPHIFKKLNEKLLKEKAEVQKSLAKVKESMPKPIDYKEKILKFTDAVNALQDPNISVKTTNKYLRDIIDRIEIHRPPAIKITQENLHLYKEEAKARKMFHTEPYTIRIKLKD